MMASFVQDLAVQVGQVGKHLAKHPTAEAPCIRPQRLQEFVTEADVRVQHLQKCLEEIDEATESLRQWFAEPPSSSLHDMLKALAALRQLLPAPKPSETLSPAPDYRLSTTRKRRLEEKKKAREQRKAQEDANTAVTMEIPSEGQAQGEPEEPEVPKNDAGDQAREMPKGEAEDAKEAAEGSLLPIPNSIQSEACQVEPPSGVLAQILSFSKGTIWISWLFDWSDVRRGFASGADHMCAFEVVHFGESEELNSRPSSRWRCPTAPLKMDVPLGCHYVFGVRAILLKGDQLHDSEMLWASPISSPVMLDLRYSTSSIGNVSTSLPVGSVGSRLISPPMEEKSPQGTPRRGRVASSMGDFISSLQSGGSPTTRRLSLRPPSGRSGTPKEEDEASGKSTLESCQASLEKGSFVEMEVEKSQHQELTLPVGRGADAVDESQSPSSVPIPSKQSDESCSAETPLSVGDLDEFDDESLLRLVQAFTYLETRRSRTTEAGVCGTPSSSDAKDAPEPPKAQEVDVAKTLPAKEPAAEVKPSQAHKAAFRVPRATSVFDDLGTLESMADVLSNVEAVNRDTNLESPSSGCQLEAQGTSEILDGAEVLAEIERKFVQQRKTCEACNGTGYVGLFGATGFGFFQTKCSSCSK
ncbi:unnamed protein product [Durusdinium trenchii]|uniref:Fibronectin type-III domain-containing protein n=1 Tax=Durusdinium trenchii TaxID=1381693 RepID=A0ABP0SIH3_9DINO